MNKGKNLLKLITVLCTVLAWSFGLSAAPRKVVLTTSPAKIMPLFSDKHNILKSLSSMLSKVGAGGTIYLSTFMLTDSDFVTSLIEAHKRGASVNICVDRSSDYYSKEVFGKLIAAGIEVHLFNGDFSVVASKNAVVKNHAKLLAWHYPEVVNQTTTTQQDNTQQTDAQPSVPQTVMRYRVALGSANHTKLSHINKEHTTVIPNDEEMYKEIKAIFERARANSTPFSVIQKDGITKSWGTSPQLATPKAAPETPKKTKLFNSITHNLTDIITKRIANTTNALSSIRVNSYTLNNQKITQELIDAKNRGIDVTVIADQVVVQKEVDTLEKNENYISQLKQLRAAGIPVKIFDRSGKNHCKTIEIERKDDAGSSTLVMESTGNLTDSTDRDINVLSIYPNNPEVFNEFTNFHTRVSTLSSDYSPVKKAFIAKRDAKRKLEAAFTEAAAEENAQPSKRACKN